MAVLGLALGGCGLTGAGPITARSVNNQFDLQLLPTLRAYSSLDKNTADIYLTDLPREVLALGAPLNDSSGQILHVHLFISPEAGETPIDHTACSVAVRLVIISRGQIGMYGGGGFLLPDSDPGDATFAGDMRGATLRFLGSTPGFADRLGPAELSGSIEAPKDDATSTLVARRLDELLGRLKSPPPTTTPEPAKSEPAKTEPSKPEPGKP
ncbi:MAG: hypothetical protein AMXMBFR58_35590 [Phycisphaerae bacterium]|nr:hypothetical protein [Phycisphaerales bacterium]